MSVTDIIASATKETPNSSIGVLFKSYSRTSRRVYVLTIKTEGIFDKTELRQGQEVLSVNGVSVRGMSAREVADVISNIDSEVIIHAKPAKITVPPNCDRDTVAEELDRIENVNNRGSSSANRPRSHALYTRGRNPSLLVRRGIYV